MAKWHKGERYSLKGRKSLPVASARGAGLALMAAHGSTRPDELVQGSDPRLRGGGIGYHFYPGGLGEGGGGMWTGFSAAQRRALIANQPFSAGGVLYADPAGALKTDAGLTYNQDTNALTAGSLITSQIGPAAHVNLLQLASGILAVDGRLRVAAGSAALPAIAKTGDENTGRYWVGANNMRDVCGGVTRIDYGTDTLGLLAAAAANRSVNLFDYLYPDANPEYCLHDWVYGDWRGGAKAGETAAAYFIYTMRWDDGDVHTAHVKTVRIDGPGYHGDFTGTVPDNTALYIRPTAGPGGGVVVNNNGIYMETPVGATNNYYQRFGSHFDWTAGGDFRMAPTGRVILDALPAGVGHAHTSIRESADNVLRFEVGGADQWEMTAATWRPVLDNSEYIGDGTHGVKGFYFSDINEDALTAEGETRAQKIRRSFQGRIGSTTGNFERLIHSQVADTSDSGVGEGIVSTYTVPGSSWAAGKVYHFAASGVCSIPGGESVTIRVRIGGIAGTILLAEPLTTSSSEWRLSGELVCRTRAPVGAIAWGASIVCKAVNTDAESSSGALNTATGQALVVTHDGSHLGAETTIKTFEVWEA